MAPQEPVWQNQDFLELKFPAKAEYVGVVRLLISGLASRMGFSYDEIEDMKIAVAEACSNVVSHAYDNDNGQMIVECRPMRDRLQITVIDHGQSFDADAVRQDTGPINTQAMIEDLSEGGLGLFLIDTLMDSVQIVGEDGIKVVMCKQIQRAEVQNG